MSYDDESTRRDRDRGERPRLVDNFDRMIGNLTGLPEAIHTRPSTIRTIAPIVGVSELFIVQTFRQRDEGDTIFLEHVASGQNVRLVIPREVADCIARQRDQLTQRSRSRAAKAVAAERKRQGIAPFVKRQA